MLAPGDPSAALWQAFWKVYHPLLEGRTTTAFVAQLGSGAGRRMNPGSAIAFAAEVFGLKYEALIAQRKVAELVEARALAVWALRELGDPWSYPAIGRAMGGRDHSTIINLYRRAKEMRAASPRFAGACEDIRAFFETEEEIDDTDGC